MSNAAWSPPRADDWQHRRIVVRHGELTCLACGETFSAHDVCPRCGLTNDGQQRAVLPLAIPTINYLHTTEYELQGA